MAGFIDYVLDHPDWNRPIRGEPDLAPVSRSGGPDDGKPVPAFLRSERLLRNPSLPPAPTLPPPVRTPPTIEEELATLLHEQGVRPRFTRTGYSPAREANRSLIRRALAKIRGGLQRDTYGRRGGVEHDDADYDSTELAAQRRDPSFLRYDSEVDHLNHGNEYGAAGYVDRDTARNFADFYGVSKVATSNRALVVGVEDRINPETAPVTDDEMNTFISRVKELNTCVAQQKAEIENLKAQIALRDSQLAELTKTHDGVLEKLHGIHALINPQVPNV